RGETLSSRLYHLNFAGAVELAKTVERALTSDGSVNVDVRTNSLLVRDTEDSLLELAGLIEELDRPTPQVMIEARIVEATTNFARELGIRWGFDYSRTGTANQIDVFGTDTGNSLVNLPSTTVHGGIGISYATLSGSLDLDLELTAMEDKGWGKIISSPKIATLENNDAIIKSGVRIPVQRVTVQEGLGTTETEFIEAVLSLKVRPQVTSQGRIILDIVADRSVPDWGRVVDGFPTILTREAQTRVMVKDGETVVIGGLLQETEGEDTSRVPIISDIPIIGGIFKSKSKTLDTEELLIFITPKLITL
ncbi:MAG: type IV pilus secretin PilQ, partial [bacterium]